MTNCRMKKVLLIDDKVIESANKDVFVYMVDKWSSERIAEYSDLVDISRSANDYFKWDQAGNDCNPLFNKTEYDFIFIHHSQKGDSIIPSNVIDLIKRDFGDKLVLFSGNIRENFLNTENFGFTYRSIQRQKLWDRFREFLKKSDILNEWVIEILYFDYEKHLVGKIMNLLDHDSSRDFINKSNEMKHYLKLKYVEPGSSKYQRIIDCTDEELVDELRKL